MYEKMHILSPLVAPREFFFIRHCRQMSADTWAMVDVSYDIFRQFQDASPSRSWKLPSGCIIQDKSNSKSLVRSYTSRILSFFPTHNISNNILIHLYIYIGNMGGARSSGRQITNAPSLQRLGMQLPCLRSQAMDSYAAEDVRESHNLNRPTHNTHPRT